jgi:hypothetical protein
MEDLMRRMLQLLQPDRGRFILVRSRDRAASAAFVEEVLVRHVGLSRIVLHSRRSDPALYRTSTLVPGGGGVVLASDVPGSVDLTARALNAANSVMTDGPNDLIVRMLWLPPSVLEGYSQLPATPESVLVIDDWHTLVMDYLGEGIPRALNAPVAEELDRLLADAFEALSEAHLIVVTSGRALELESAADAIFEVRLLDHPNASVEIRIERDTLELPPSTPYILRITPEGRLT